MDIATIQALAAIVNAVGFVGTLGLIALVFAFNLAPVLAEYLRAKIASTKAETQHVVAQTDAIRTNGTPKT